MFIEIRYVRTTQPIVLDPTCSRPYISINSIVSIYSGKWAHKLSIPLTLFCKRQRRPTTQHQTRYAVAFTMRHNKQSAFCIAFKYSSYYTLLKRIGLSHTIRGMIERNATSSTRPYSIMLDVIHVAFDHRSNEITDGFARFAGGRHRYTCARCHR